MATCLTCTRYSILYHPFQFVELCAFSKEKNIFGEPFKLKGKCNDAKCNVLAFQPFCSIPLVINSHGVTSKEFLPCQNVTFDSNQQSQSVELVCPSNFKMRYPVEKTDSKGIVISSVCAGCKNNSESDVSGQKPLITVCSPHYGNTSNSTFTFKYIQQNNIKKNNIPTKPPITCGFQLTSPGNFSKYLPCQTDKEDRTMVNSH